VIADVGNGQARIAAASSRTPRGEVELRTLARGFFMASALRLPMT
jgi:hypothetical protein